MITLGIETSCDDTALALIETRDNGGKFECRVISSLVNSQADLHSEYGGVFPTLAKREHGKNILPLLKKLLEKYDHEHGHKYNHESTAVISDSKYNEVIKSFRIDIEKPNPDLYEAFMNIAKDPKCNFLKEIPSIDRIAITQGPGLEPALWVGINFARIISALWSIPMIPINHMEGHILGSLLPEFPEVQLQGVPEVELQEIKFPAIALLISGGHTELVKIENNNTNDSQSPSKFNFNYTILGQTRDDAVGEAFDKAARLLGLPYPGGPHISKLSAEAEAQGIVSQIKLPRPMIHSGDLNFSFSGLKTAVLYAVRDAIKTNTNQDLKQNLPISNTFDAKKPASDGTLTDDFKKGLAREFEEAVTETLSRKLSSAIGETGAKTVIIGGGVSANTMLRNEFTKVADKYGVPIYLPSKHVSGDNALMIALAGALDTKNHLEAIKAQGTKRLGNENGNN